MKSFKKEDLAVYAVTDTSWLGEQTLYEQVKQAILGGATCIQLREKHLEEDAFQKEAVEIQMLCHAYHIPFLVNDNVTIAVAMDADGVHVGQSDMPANIVREKIGSDKILGVSAQNVEQAVLAQQQGADYIGVGAIFPTDSKDDADSVSLDTLKCICDAVSIPVVAIGGISQNNLARLEGTGIAGIAVISAIFAQPDIQLATQKLQTAVNKILIGN